MSTDADLCYDFSAMAGPPPLGPARAWLRDRLSNLPPTIVQDAELLATELITNAYEHAAGALELRVRLRTDRRVLRIEVDDARPELLPQPRSEQTGTERTGVEPGGRGLLLVTALGTAWGVLVGPACKTTWVELPLA
jgi:anti-sigma regulatory factor (Ser/Thr protein kinase)